ncbi:MAG: hypothetical protein WC575_04760 [Patescibacteria group bacterium]
MRYNIQKSTVDPNNSEIRKVQQESCQRIKKLHDDLRVSKRRGEAMVREMRIVRGENPDGGPYR